MIGTTHIPNPAPIPHRILYKFDVNDIIHNTTRNGTYLPAANPINVPVVLIKLPPIANSPVDIHNAPFLPYRLTKYEARSEPTRPPRVYTLVTAENAPSVMGIQGDTTLSSGIPPSLQVTTA
jgi:hypothetical protein